MLHIVEYSYYPVFNEYGVQPYTKKLNRFYILGNNH